MIRVSKLADYGVVILATMAQRERRLQTAPQLADTTGVQLPTVAKLLRQFVKHGLVSSHRGIQGGYSLARQPGQITVEDIVVAVDGPVALTACVDGAVGCGIEQTCAMRGRWDKLNKAMRTALQSVTLADMMESVRLELAARAELRDALAVGAD